MGQGMGDGPQVPQEFLNIGTKAGALAEKYADVPVLKDLADLTFDPATEELDPQVMRDTIEAALPDLATAIASTKRATKKAALTNLQKTLKRAIAALDQVVENDNARDELDAARNAINKDAQAARNTAIKEQMQKQADAMKANPMGMMGQSGQGMMPGMNPGAMGANGSGMNQMSAQTGYQGAKGVQQGYPATEQTTGAQPMMGNMGGAGMMSRTRWDMANEWANMPENKGKWTAESALKDAPADIKARWDGALAMQGNMQQGMTGGKSGQPGSQQFPTGNANQYSSPQFGQTNQQSAPGNSYVGTPPMQGGNMPAGMPQMTPAQAAAMAGSMMGSMPGAGVMGATPFMNQAGNANQYPSPQFGQTNQQSAPGNSYVGTPSVQGGNVPQNGMPQMGQPMGGMMPPKPPTANVVDSFFGGFFRFLGL